MTTINKSNVNDYKPHCSINISETTDEEEKKENINYKPYQIDNVINNNTIAIVIHDTKPTPKPTTPKAKAKKEKSSENTSEDCYELAYPTNCYHLIFIIGLLALNCYNLIINQHTQALTTSIIYIVAMTGKTINVMYNMYINYNKQELFTQDKEYETITSQILVYQFFNGNPVTFSAQLLALISNCVVLAKHYYTFEQNIIIGMIICIVVMHPIFTIAHMALSNYETSLEYYKKKHDI